MHNFQIFEVPLEGKNLVEASAGTGKTFNITSLYIRALIEKKLTTSQILVLTYTENATAELKHRIRTRILDCIQVIEGSKVSGDDLFLKEIKNKANINDLELLKKALFSFDESVISTIHGFCQKLLREYSLDFGVQSDFEIATNITDIVQDSVDEYWRNYIKVNSNSKLGKCKIELLKEWKFTPEKLNDLVLRLLSKPYAQLLPKPPNNEAVKQLLSKIEALYSSLQSQWVLDKEEINTLLNSGVLVGKKLNKNTRKNLITDCEAWLDNDISIPLNKFKNMERLGHEFLIESAKPGKIVNPPQFSYLLDDYLELHASLIELRNHFLHDIYEQTLSKIKELKDRKNALSFDDLLQVVEANLSERLITKISAQYPMALVDEFQDTDPIQYSIFTKIFSQSHSVLFMIGDPKQAIYGFRGADLFTYFNAIQDVEENKRFSLNHNYRSTQSIIQANNKLFNRFDLPFVFEQPKFRDSHFPESKENEMFTFNDEEWPAISFISSDISGNIDPLKEEISDYVTLQINELLTKNFKLGDKYVQPKDIAILVNNKKQAELIKSKLAEIDIQCSIKSKNSVFETDESDEILLLLTTLQNLGHKGKIRALLTSSLIGYSAKDLNELKEDEQKWTDINNCLKTASDLWSKFGVAVAFNEIDKFFNCKVRISTLNNAERRLTNLEHILELLTEEEHVNHLSKGSLIRYLYNKINTNDDDKSDEEILRLESDSELLTISTIHASKGLEYSIVFIPFIWDDFNKTNNKNLQVTEYHNDANSLCINVEKNPPAEISNLANMELLANALRLNYVAFTRAKYACFIPYIKSYKNLVKSSLAYTVCNPNNYENKILNDELLVEFEEELSKLNEKKEFQHKSTQEILELTLSAKKRIEDAASNDIELQVKQNLRNDLYEFERMLSFSSLTSKLHDFNDSAKDLDEIEDEQSHTDEVNEEELSRYTFPKGANTGNLLHYIFENIQFDNPESYEEQIKEQIISFNFDEKWLDVCINWISDCMNHKLKDNLRLSELSEQSVLKEMEFYFPIKSINYELLTHLIRGEKLDNSDENLFGFMKGFIDLTFEYEGKYYILDYKSNYLGNDVDDYSNFALKEAMVHSNYDIQYYIYTCALTLYLKNRISDFDYERDFGGVIYFFLRGCDLNNPESGVYFDKPKWSKINQILKVMGAKNE